MLLYVEFFDIVAIIAAAEASIIGAGQPLVVYFGVQVNERTVS